MKFMVEGRGRKRIVERVLLGLVAAAAVVIAPPGVARARQVQQAADHWHKAEAFFHAGKWQEAELAFRDSLQADPTFYPAREALAGIAWSRQDYNACLREYQEAHRVDPRSPEPLLALGQIHFKRRNFAAAVPYLEQVLALDSSHLAAQRLLRSCRAGARDDPVAPSGPTQPSPAQDVHAHAH
jgi:tetratricopeptide (TPR) repeat protein